MGIFGALMALLSGSSKTATTSTLTHPVVPGHGDDLIKGYRFCATMQFRTPLRVLRRHGEIHSDLSRPLPRIEQATWEGCWLPVTKTYREMGLDIDEPRPSTMASEFGQIPNDGGDYLPFLLAIREIVEANAPACERIARLYQLADSEPWQSFPGWGMGVESVVVRFFPPFLASIPRLSIAAAAELSSLDLDTPNRLASAPDDILLGVKGIGPNILKSIRTRCAEVTDSRDSARLENVVR